MRRLKPNVYLDAKLLDAIADAPVQEGKPVRLIRRLGDRTFEFVHDQMHAYLAARWFAQHGVTTAELLKRVEESTTWKQTLVARRTLWDFAAVLLDDERLNEAECSR